MRFCQYPGPLRRPQLTYANVMATLALFVALGGSSYAVTRLPANSVGSAQVRDGSLHRADLARDARGGSGGARGPRGAQGPAGPAGAIGPSNAIVARRDPPTFAGTGANTWTDVLTLQAVPPGDYWLSALTNVIYTGATQAYFRCRVVVDGTDVGDNTVTRVGNSAGASQGAIIARQEPLHLDAAASVVKLRCGHFEATDDPNGRFERSRLALIRTGSVAVSDQ